MTDDFSKTVIRVRGAAEHNLKGLDVDLPHGKVIAMCGVSGSGKSTLAIDTLFAEARRRYLMSLGHSGRGLLRNIKAPKVAQIEGLSPAVSIGQSRGPQNPRSTVATLAGVYDYLRLLFAKLGRPHCVACGGQVVFQRFEEVLETAAGLRDGTKLTVMAPRQLEIAENGSGEPADDPTSAFLAWVDRVGYRRIRIDGVMVLIDNVDRELRPENRLEVVVDRIVVKPETRRRLKGSLQAALEVGSGRVVLGVGEGGEDLVFSVRPTCSACGTPSRPLTPELFSFNSSHGACPTCRGQGTQDGLNPDRLFDQGRANLEDALGLLWQEFGHRELHDKLTRFCQARRVEFDHPLADWPAAVADKLWEGTGRGGRGGFSGLQRWFSALRRTGGQDEQSWLDEILGDEECTLCGGSRLVADARAVRLGEHTIDAISAMTVGEAAQWAGDLNFAGNLESVGSTISVQIWHHLDTLVQLGLDYLALNRRADSLSSGEYQRVRLATALGSGMTRVLYVLDEPSAGLHCRDVGRLQRAVERLRDGGNTVVVVDHDRTVIEGADHIVELGPGAGPNGGRIVAQGLAKEVAEADTPSGRFLAGDLPLPQAESRTPGEEGWLRLERAVGHNLKEVTVSIPLGNLVAVTGVSGSGKTTLISDTLYPLLARELQSGERLPLASGGCTGVELVQRVVAVDQRPIGRNVRSNAATYTGLLAYIRRLYSELPEARMRAYAPAHFSFNAPEGACQECSGRGGQVVKQQVFEDLEVVCEACGGTRYRSEVLDVRYRGHSVADVLAMTVCQALMIFAPVPDLARRLQTLDEVGLGYLTLGQPATSFSGGEAQRVKLATELSRPQQDHSLFILDEPTTGLHQEDVAHLLALLQRLVSQRNTVLVIEHQIDLIATCDYVVDMGPEGGAAGGRVLAQGTPRQIAESPESVTGRYLKSFLGP